MMGPMGTGGLTRLILTVLIPGRMLGQVVLSEIMFDPAGPEQTDEYIEIVNCDTVFGVDLTGWSVGDEDRTDRLRDCGQGLTLGPGQYGLILDSDYFTSDRNYDSRIPSDALIMTVNGKTLGSRGLSNAGGEKIRLIDEQGIPAAGYRYTPGNGSGYSEEKMDLSLEDISENWRDSRVFNGTPGFLNSVAAGGAPQSLWVGVDPNPFSPDGDGIDDFTRILFRLPIETSWANLRIYDVRGRMVRLLLGGTRVRGDVTVVWDGRDDAGYFLKTGLYICFLECLDVEAGKRLSSKSTLVLVREKDALR